MGSSCDTKSISKILENEKNKARTKTCNGKEQEEMEKENKFRIQVKNDLLIWFALAIEMWWMNLDFINASLWCFNT